MVQVLQKPNFPVSPLGVDWTLKGPGELLNSHTNPHLSVLSGAAGRKHTHLNTPEPEEGHGNL